LALYGYIPSEVARENAQKAISAGLGLDPTSGLLYGSRGWLRVTAPHA
jgi:hypothetical protein